MRNSRESLRRCSVRSSGKLRILLDSTYILPIVGVEVEGLREALAALRELRRERRAKFYYTPFNILEVLGKIAKLDYDASIVAAGLSAIEEELELTYPTVEGYLKALELRRRGFRDLIDLLLYATAVTRGLLLLTRDECLIQFLESQGESVKSILSEEELLSMTRRERPAEES